MRAERSASRTLEDAPGVDARELHGRVEVAGLVEARERDREPQRLGRQVCNPVLELPADLSGQILALEVAAELPSAGRAEDSPAIEQIPQNLDDDVGVAVAFLHNPLDECRGHFEVAERAADERRDFRVAQPLQLELRDSRPILRRSAKLSERVLLELAAVERRRDHEDFRPRHPVFERCVKERIDEPESRALRLVEVVEADDDAPPLTAGQRSGSDLVDDLLVTLHVTASSILQALHEEDALVEVGEATGFAAELLHARDVGEQPLEAPSRGPPLLAGDVVEVRAARLRPTAKILDDSAFLQPFLPSQDDEAAFRHAKIVDG
jgi:hypothetical protein